MWSFTRPEASPSERIEMNSWECPGWSETFTHERHAKGPCGMKLPTGFDRGQISGKLLKTYGLAETTKRETPPRIGDR
jgi:hypothetical protein